ncbi:hypothetical protein TVAG_476210 [Trichomonas vaginalis G3]|uniref:Uncharacterized protein n=1 Tax=Trichomonas vaginalis (strain ATCC PRA-98 / G3) TaxID=412133 RepID=A2DA44_TRIV3|nr:armadillo (ARM) repeat-containing protein family [Trichomonas vaginalis G3]EAY22692.1 hypothetical protein TVAG_476210 [Trichomonas vaginalis G3]KAI5525505.1 armadillo (ARM) repeat-containing protein family [Trichomonas vaginalis G3]|eukprot:XP_001583678.1 hypothetical protein [Trichomonas vaginalis G3]
MDDEYKSNPAEATENFKLIQKIKKMQNLELNQVKYINSEKNCDIGTEQDIISLIQSEELTIDNLSQLLPKEMPVFSEEFIDILFEFIDNSPANRFDFIDAFSCNRTNAINLFKRGILEILISFLPITYELLAKIIEICSNYNCQSWFVEIGGLFALTFFSKTRDYDDPISRILLSISTYNFYTQDVLSTPESTLHPIEIVDLPEDPIYLNELFFNLHSSDDPQILSRLYLSLSNLFERSDPACIAFGSLVLDEFDSMINNIEVRASFILCISKCIPITPIENPFVLLDNLDEYLLCEDDDNFVLASLEVLDSLISRYGIEIFEESPAIDAVLSLCNDSRFDIKLHAAHSLSNVIECAIHSHCEILIRMGVIEFLLEFVDTIGGASMKELMRSLGEFIGYALISDLPDDLNEKVTSYIEEVERMMYDHDTEEVRDEAEKCWNLFEPFLDECSKPL